LAIDQLKGISWVSSHFNTGLLLFYWWRKLQQYRNAISTIKNPRI